MHASDHSDGIGRVNEVSSCIVRVTEKLCLKFPCTESSGTVSRDPIFVNDLDIDAVALKTLLSKLIMPLALIKLPLKDKTRLKMDLF